MWFRFQHTGWCTFEKFLATLTCPSCGEIDRWQPCKRLERRRNSRIGVVTCRVCSYRVAIKQCSKTDADVVNREEAKREYETLGRVYLRYPIDPHYGVPKPLYFSESEGTFAMEFASGWSLEERLKRGCNWAASSSMERAGRWLRLLHECSSVGEGLIDLDEKFRVVQKQWGDGKPANKHIQPALDLLSETRFSMKTKEIAKVMLHGDFKPENLVMDENHTVGVDIGWRCANAVEYDLAPFLNHLLFLRLGLRRKYINQQIEEMEEHFLTGYFQSHQTDLCLLNWIRLYFLLSYWNTWCNSGPVRATLASRFFPSLIGEASHRLSQSVRRSLIK